jgi:ferredoxin
MNTIAARGISRAASRCAWGTFQRAHWRARRNWNYEDQILAYIITEPCIGTKDSACVDVCPVDCIHPRKDEGDFEGATQLYIHPDECIDCGACVPACPVEAIFALDEVPEKWKNYIEINSKHFQK